MRIKSANLKIALAMTAILSLFIAFSAIRYYYSESSYRFNGNQLFTLTDQWLELTPENNVSCGREYQRLFLTIVTPYEVMNQCSDCPKIKLQDGTLPIIKCELVGKDGSIYRYRFAGIVSEGKAQYIMFDEDSNLAQRARKREYRAVRVRSSRPILCAEARLRLS